MIIAYEHLAAEYYDAELHPTCDDFRRASAQLIEGFLDGLEVPAGPLLELGAGRSLLLECWRAAGRASRDTLLTDASFGMLLHSEEFRSDGAWLVAANAAHLPVADCAVALACAALGDPYNTGATWAEVSRVLQPGGICLFTTPAFAWTEHFRPRHQGGQGDVAAFVLSRTVPFEVPSIVLPEDKQTALFRAQGLSVERVRHVSRGSLAGGFRSPKLAADGYPDAAPITTGYVIRRTG